MFRLFRLSHFLMEQNVKDILILKSVFRANYAGFISPFMALKNSLACCEPMM